MESGIRPYGAGKFNTILDSYVYEVSLQGGCDDDMGSVQEDGVWYGLMKNGHTIFQDHDPGMEKLNEDERKKLSECAGVIIREDSNGFVHVSYYETSADLDTAWRDVEAALAEADIV
jgi:hypothetical protein